MGFFDLIHTTSSGMRVLRYNGCVTLQGDDSEVHMSETQWREILTYAVAEALLEASGEKVDRVYGT